jgi:hypothetical protein
MADLKTKPTPQSVQEFLGTIADPVRRKECRAIARIMREATGAKATMWGTSIVGFGSYHYRYASGREGDFFLTGFSPRKQNLTLYIMSGFTGYQTLLRRLGKHSIGKSCLYVKSLEQVDLGVLTQLIEQSVIHMKSRRG